MNIHLFNNSKLLFLLVFIAMGTGLAIAQDAQNDKEAKTAYYEQRAKQDAAFEHTYVAESEVEEEAFWNEQNKYEQELKKEDKKAYMAYMRGKRTAYREHHKHCSSHCNHSEHYTTQASFYYHSRKRYYSRPQNRATINTNVRINTPKVHLGF